MKKPAISKKTIIIAVVAVVLVIVYFYFQGSPSNVSSSGSLLSGAAVSGSDVGSSELALLNQIQSLRIDTSVFSDPAFQSLQDYSVAIPTENVGRPNPFAPLSGMSTTTANTASTPLSSVTNSLTPGH